MTTVYEVPGSRAPAVVQTYRFMRDPVGFFERARERHGPMFRARFIGFPRFLYVATPALAREVYASDRTVGRAAPARKDFLEPIVGRNSLLLLEDDAWLRHRKLLGPAFHRRQVAEYEDEIARLARDVLAGVPLGEPFALRPVMQEITLEVILRLVFGVADEARLARLRDLLPRMIDVGDSPLIWIAPRLLARPRSRWLARRVPSRLASLLAVREEVDAALFEEIRARRLAGVDGRTDVLSHMLASRDEDGGTLSDAELRDELVTLLVAGHETTATGLAWTFERLVRTPRAMERLELSLSDGEGSGEYLRAVVKESLRTRTVVIDTPRLFTGPLRVGDVEVPEGWYVAPAIPLVQHDPSAFDAPDEFRPERFLNGSGGGDSGGGAREGWIPFGGGKRHCVGSHLALLELEVIVRETVRALELSAVDPAPEAPRLQHVTIVPDELARVRARAREGVPVAASP